MTKSDMNWLFKEGVRESVRESSLRKLFEKRIKKYSLRILSNAPNCLTE